MTPQVRSTRTGGLGYRWCWIRSSLAVGGRSHRSCRQRAVCLCASAFNLRLFGQLCALCLGLDLRNVLGCVHSRLWLRILTQLTLIRQLQLM